MRTKKYHEKLIEVRRNNRIVEQDLIRAIAYFTAMSEIPKRNKQIETIVQGI